MTASVELSARRPFIVLLVWALVSLWGGLGAMHLSSAITNSFNPPKGADSARVERLMTERFSKMSGSHVLLVLHGDPGRREARPAFRAYEVAIEARLRANPMVDRLLTPETMHVNLGLPPETSFIVATFKGTIAQDVMVPRLRQAVAAVASPPGVAHELTDMPAISYDIYHHTAGELAKVERVGLLLSAIVLIYVFGGVFAASLPLLTGLLCITINNGLLAFIGRFLETSTTNQFMTAIIGLAIGIDYPLFLLSRVREELQAGVDPLGAFKRAVCTSGKAIAFSGAIVAVSSLCLGLMDVSGLRTAALSVLGIVLTALALCFSFIPALVFGAGGFVPVERLLSHRFKLSCGTHLWDRVIGFVVDRPRRHLVASGLLLTLLTVPVLGARFWSPTISMLPRQLESMRGLSVLAQAKQSGQLAPIYVTVSAPRPGGAYQATFIKGLWGLVHDLQRDPRVGQVVSMVSFQPAWSYPQYQAFFNNPFMRGDSQLGLLVDNAHGGRTALLRVVPATAPDSEATRALVRDIRGRYVPGHRADLPGAVVAVGGEQAKLLDIASGFTRTLPLVACLNLLAVTLILGAYFRSVFLPIKAIVMNLLPLLGAFGIVILVFQHGIGAGLMGLEPPGYVMLMTPAILLTVLFALSMDYEIIILSRIKEAYDRTGDNRAAILEGLGQSGKVIVGAAAIMFSLFFAYVFADVTPMREVGLGLATAILIDATLVRLVVLPATMMLMGRWNYWLPHFTSRRSAAKAKQSNVLAPLA